MDGRASRNLWNGTAEDFLRDPDESPGNFDNGNAGRGAKSRIQPGLYVPSRIFTAGGILVSFQGLAASEASRKEVARLSR